MENIKAIIVASLVINVYGFIMNNNFKRYNSNNRLRMSLNRDNSRYSVDNSLLNNINSFSVFLNNTKYDQSVNNTLLNNINSFSMFLNSEKNTVKYNNNYYLKSYSNYLNIN